MFYHKNFKLFPLNSKLYGAVVLELQEILFLGSMMMASPRIPRSLPHNVLILFTVLRPLRHTASDFVKRVFAS